MVSKNSIFICLSLIILLIMSTQIVARQMNSEASASLTQAMNGNNISETKKVGRHLVKGLGKIFRAGKVIYCKTCKTCHGLCDYCCA
uniref:SAR8.2 protein n=1 Tax=Capsicum annuum TaxID=4072 RepID=Q947G6_CAPAN|nr:SAR8.2 protein precursor [Capsicum annuum]